MSTAIVKLDNKIKNTVGEKMKEIMIVLLINLYERSRDHLSVNMSKTSNINVMRKYYGNDEN